jgi:hypothetical protein
MSAKPEFIVYSKYRRRAPVRTSNGTHTSRLAPGDLHPRPAVAAAVDEDRGIDRVAAARDQLRAVTADPIRPFRGTEAPS